MQTIQHAIKTTSQIFTKKQNIRGTIFVVEGSLAENVRKSTLCISTARWNCV